jgi:hypothetical protein
MVVAGAILAVPLIAVAAIAAPRAGSTRPLLAAAAIAGASEVLLALIEQKPWFYHQLPALLTPLAAIGLAIVAALPRMTTGRQGVVAALVLAAVIPGLLFLTAWRSQARLLAGYRADPLVQDLRRTLVPGDPWAVVSVNALPAFPTTLIEGYRWVLRGPSLWPLPGAVQLAARGGADAGAAIRSDVAEGLAADIEQGRPKLIVVDPRPNALLPQGDILALLLQTPHFASVWAGYRLERRVGGVDLYVPRENP